MSSQLIGSVIDPDRWDEAHWIAVAFILNYDHPPFLGLVFGNGKAGREIFTTWRRLFGRVDAREGLRIAFIEGDIPGRAAGHSVHITGEPGVTFQRMKSLLGPHLTGAPFVQLSKVRRFHNDTRWPNLSDFMQDFREYQRYFLIPVTLDLVRREMEPHFELAIEKRRLYRRDVSEITDDNIDRVVFL